MVEELFAKAQHFFRDLLPPAHPVPAPPPPPPPPCEGGFSYHRDSFCAGRGEKQTTRYALACPPLAAQSLSFSRPDAGIRHLDLAVFKRVFRWWTPPLSGFDAKQCRKSPRCESILSAAGSLQPKTKRVVWFQCQSGMCHFTNAHPPPKSLARPVLKTVSRIH